MDLNKILTNVKIDTRDYGYLQFYNNLLQSIRPVDHINAGCNKYTYYINHRKL